MKHKLIFAFSIFAIIFYSCKKEVLPINEAKQNNTLFETSFENNNDISEWNLFYDYYFGVEYDTIVNSTCTNGGQKALNIKAQRKKTSFAEKYISNVSGNKILTLSFYATLYSGQNSATASLSQIRNGIIVKNKEINLGIWNDWEKFNVIDTLNLVTSDSIKIKFEGKGSTYESSDFIIDLVKLVKN